MKEFKTDDHTLVTIRQVNYSTVVELEYSPIQEQRMNEIYQEYRKLDGKQIKRRRELREEYKVIGEELNSLERKGKKKKGEGIYNTILK